jgi:hypothetical protein
MKFFADVTCNVRYKYRIRTVPGKCGMRCTSYYVLGTSLRLLYNVLPGICTSGTICVCSFHYGTLEYCTTLLVDILFIYNNGVVLCRSSTLLIVEGEGDRIMQSCIICHSKHHHAIAIIKG